MKDGSVWLHTLKVAVCPVGDEQGRILTAAHCHFSVIEKARILSVKKFFKKIVFTDKIRSFRSQEQKSESEQQREKGIGRCWRWEHGAGKMCGWWRHPRGGSAWRCLHT
jgi:hypothetical protein